MSSYIYMALRYTLGKARYALSFAFISIAVCSLYCYLLSSSSFGLLILGKHYLLYMIPATAALSTLVGLSAVVEVASFGRNASGFSLGAAVLGLLPGLCCSPLLPTVLTSLGGSYFAIRYSGEIQGTLALYGFLLLALAFVMSALSLVRGSKRLAECDECRVARVRESGK